MIESDICSINMFRISKEHEKEQITNPPSFDIVVHAVYVCFVYFLLAQENQT